MDFLKAEIERKKRQLQEKNILGPDKKYFKRGDLAAKQEEEYWKKHKRWKPEEEVPTTSGETSEPDDMESKLAKITEESQKMMLPRQEVIRRLRERNEPVRLFGESDHEASLRLRKLEILEPEVNKGFNNDLKTALDKVDAEYLNEIVQSHGGDASSTNNDVKVLEIDLTDEDLQKMKEELEVCDSDRSQEILLKYLKFILHLWGKELNSRPEEEKRAIRGKLESATHTQTVSYLKPLLRHLKQKKVQQDILECLVDILKYLLDKNYMKANDAYYEMAIGNAPWPVGVTMVGIHARTGREKIFARNVAHVLNDETQRKYIQALKRLMTHIQRFYPTDPSRMVNYEPPKK